MSHEIIEIEDKASGLLGWVAIDSLFDGQASGGLRMDPAVDADQLGALARTMSAKYGWYGMPKGGAKAGIRQDPEDDPDRVRALLRRFGEKIAPLVRERRYFPGPDMGTDDALIRVVLEGAGIRADDSALWDTSDSGRFTAAGVVASLAVALERTRGESLAGARVQIEGIGAVGGNAWRMLHERGAVVVAVSNRHGAIANDDGIEPGPFFEFLAAEGGRAIARYPGARPIEKAAFAGLATDAFLPCGASFTIREEEARRIAAPLVVPGANNPVFGPSWRTFEERGASPLVLPDFVVNGGGVVGGALRYAGLSIDETVAAVTSIVGSSTAALVRDGERGGTLARGGRALTERAETIARARFREMQAKPRSRLLLWGMRAKRIGLLPGFLGRAGAARHARTLADRVGRIDP